MPDLWKPGVGFSDLRPERSRARFDTMNREFVRGWVLMNVVAGVFAGLTTPALSHFLTETISAGGAVPSQTQVLGSMLALGVLEGLIVGLAQWRAIRTRLSADMKLPWVVSTAWGFASGWLFAAISSPGESAVDLNSTWALIVAGVNGLLLGSTIGGMQAWCLRHRLRRPVLWVPVNMLAWMLSLVALKICQDLIATGTDSLQFAIKNALASLIGGFVVGAITGPLLDKQVPADRPHGSD